VVLQQCVQRHLLACGCSWWQSLKLPTEAQDCKVLNAFSIWKPLIYWAYAWPEFDQKRVFSSSAEDLTARD